MNPRTTGILLLVAAALFAFVWLYEIRGGDERAEAEAREKRLFAVEPEDVAWLAFTTEDGVAVRAEPLEGSSVEDALIEHVRGTGADLIAMTTHGRGGLGRLIFGSVADAVLRRAPCPILLVRVREAD